MDPEALRAAEDDLVAWGLLERTPGGLAWSRRFRGALMREAAKLAQEERAGRKPPGPPLQTAVEAALRGVELPPGKAATPTHARLLIAVELASLPDAAREFLGA